MGFLAARTRLGARPALLLTVVLAAGGLTATTVAQAPPAPAESVAEKKKRLDAELDEIRESLEGSRADLVDAAVNLKRAQANLVDAEAALGTARSALESAKEKDAALAERLKVAEAAVEKAERDLALRREQEKESRGVLGTIAREAYVNSGMTGLSIALDAQSPQQFADRMNVAGTALRQQSGTIRRLEVQQAETRAKQERLDASLDLVEELKKESEALVAERARAEEAASTAEAEVSDLVDLRSASLATIEKQRAAEKSRLAQLERESSRLSSILRGRGGNGGGGQDSGGGLSYPVNSPVTSQFGMRYHPILHYSRLHGGTDFGAPCGTPVRAAAGGSVVRAGWVGGFGNQVVVDHGRKRGKALASSYNHLSRFVVRGGRVSRGQVIAYSGTTGLSTGCHLHFEVYENGTRVNPMNWL